MPTVNETETILRLREKAGRLPLSPGVYLMKDKAGTILYVGKSKALHNRVLSYFTDLDRHTVKTARLVGRIDDFEVMLTSTEIEALALENRLIKLHTPKFCFLQSASFRKVFHGFAERAFLVPQGQGRTIRPQGRQGKIALACCCEAVQCCA